MSANSSSTAYPKYLIVLHNLHLFLSLRLFLMTHKSNLMIGAEIFDEIKQKQKRNLILCKNKLIELISLIRVSRGRLYIAYFTGGRTKLLAILFIETTFRVVRLPFG